MKNTILKQLLLCCSIIIVLISMFSCSSTINSSKYKTRFLIDVDAYGSDNYLEAKQYLLVPSDSTIYENDLQYIEFASILRNALTNINYSEAINPEEANLLISFKYGISDPKTFDRTISLPRYGQTGISSTNTTGNITTYGNSTNYNQTTTTTPTYGITGYKNYTKKITQYLRFVTITAYDLDAFKNKNEEKIVWNTIITSTGTSGDLRKVYPYLVVAGQNHFGKSSGEKIRKTIYIDDERISKIKGMSNEVK